jgi:hypothetical protein
MIPARLAGGAPAQAGSADDAQARGAPAEAPREASAAARSQPGVATQAEATAQRVQALLEETAAPAPAPSARADDRARDATRAASDPRVPARQASTPQPFEAAPLLRATPPQPQARVKPTLEPLVLAAGDAARPAQHLLRQVEGALARVELGQIASLPGDDPGTALWLLELPVRATDGELDVLPMRIEREAAAAGSEDAPLWAVSLAFDLGELGALRARITVRGETVSTLFHAERESTAERVGRRLGDFESALAGRGVKVGAVGCRAGVPEESAAADARPDGPLLEVEA